MSIHDCPSFVFRNYLALNRSEGEIVPLRFTPKQLALYAGFPAFRIRSRCPSGVCIDVRTDAAALDLVVEVANRVRPRGFFDLFIHDRFVRSIELGNDNDVPHRYEIRLHAGDPRDSDDSRDSGASGDSRDPRDSRDSGMRRITLYLPHNMEIIIRDLQWIDGDRLEATEPSSKKLLCLGDSITQGMDASCPSLTYPVRLSRRLGVDLLNQGVGGHYFDADSLDIWDPSYRPDLITVAYGTNDWKKWSSIGEFSLRIRHYLDRVIELFPSSPVFVITPLWRADCYENAEMGSFGQLIAAIEEAAGGRHPDLRVVRGLDLIPHDRALFPDRIHPNDDGFAIMADKLYDACAAQLASF